MNTLAIDIGGTNLRVLFPPRDWPVGDKPQNSDSMVLSLTYGQSRRGRRKARGAPHLGR